MSDALVKATPVDSAVEYRGLQPRSFEAMLQMAEMFSQSGMVPPQYQGQPANIMVAMQMGAEVGFSPLQALNNVDIIEGKPCFKVEALVAIAMNSPAWDESGYKPAVYSGTPKTDQWTCTVTVKRKGHVPITGQFSYGQARAAGKIDPSKPRSNWNLYPEDMLYARAMGRAIKRAFPDAIKGFRGQFEVEDEGSNETVKVANPIDAALAAAVPAVMPQPKVEVVSSTVIDAAPLPPKAPAIDIAPLIDDLRNLALAAGRKAAEAGEDSDDAYATEVGRLLHYKAKNGQVIEPTSFDYFTEQVSDEEREKRVKYLKFVHSRAMKEQAAPAQADPAPTA